MSLLLRRVQGSPRMNWIGLTFVGEDGTTFPMYFLPSSGVHGRFRMMVIGLEDTILVALSCFEAPLLASLLACIFRRANDVALPADSFILANIGMAPEWELVSSIFDVSSSSDWVSL
mmetsp:Transcript_24254/g.43898  ORF Transcript_24254/g.43898 Transcript_24254/m.43898 type:complete len:117 (-) Transcript_24254:4-354(-)